MKVYLAHAKTNYASEHDGYVLALRAVRYSLSLQSFHFLEGRQVLPIAKDASISRSRRKPELAK